MHNNPILLMFVGFITRKNEKNPVKSKKELLILRNKFYLAYFLTINKGLDLEKLRKKKMFKHQNALEIEEEKKSEDNSFRKFEDSKDLSRIVKDHSVNLEKNKEVDEILGKEKKED